MNSVAASGRRTPAPGRAPAWLIVAALLGIHGCATNPVTGWPDFVLFSESQEIETGAAYHRRILDEFALYDDPGLAAYVAAVGGRLAALSHRHELEFRFHVLDTPMVNAFALPGGYVYVTRGILALLQSEAQLAGVLGHEIGHVAARHGIRQQSRGVVVGILGSVATAAGGSGAIADLSNVLGSALLNGYGRGHELQADRLGVEYLARAGYPPTAMREVIDILAEHERYERDRAPTAAATPAIYHGLLASHPDQDRRLRSVIDAAEGRYPGDPAPPLGDFDDHIDGLVFGPGRTQGMFDGNEFLHFELDARLVFPDGWRTENRPDRLLAVSPDGAAIIQVKLDRRLGYGTPREYLEATFESPREGRSLGAGDAAGYAALTALETPFGHRDAAVAARFHGDRVFVFSGVHRDATVTGSIDRVAGSLRTLTPAERQRARPRILDQVVVRPGDDYRQLAAAADLGPRGAELLRLLNGDYPAGEPRAGRSIRVPR